jgi:transposase-like protein
MHSTPARRRHSGYLKAKVLAACEEPGASVAAVALAHDLITTLGRLEQISSDAADTPMQGLDLDTSLALSDGVENSYTMPTREESPCCLPQQPWLLAL